MPYPEPLHRLRPLPGAAGVALVLAPADAPGALARIALELVDSTRAGPLSACADVGLDALRSAIPAAAALPLLEAIARRSTEQALMLGYLPTLALRALVRRTA